MKVHPEFQELIKSLIRDGESDEWITYLWNMATFPGDHLWEIEGEEMRAAKAAERTSEALLRGAPIARFGDYSGPNRHKDRKRKRGQSED